MQRLRKKAGLVATDAVEVFWAPKQQAQQQQQAAAAAGSSSRLEAVLASQVRAAHGAAGWEGVCGWPAAQLGESFQWFCAPLPPP